MTTAFHNAIAAALSAATTAAGGPVTYARGTSTGTLSAICSPKDYDAISGDGVIVTVHCHDWLILADVLKLAPPATQDDPTPVATATVPAVGDRITDAAGAVHEVLLIPGRNCYDSGFDDIHFRVHTQKVGEATP
jgi:hypothetical protein